MDERFAAQSCFLSLGTIDTVDEFRKADRTERRFLIVRLRYDFFDQLRDRVAAPFGGDHYAGVQDQSHAGGSNGSRWLAIAASTS